MALRYRSAPVQYTGIDLFEARPVGQLGLSLKQAHRALSRSEARVRLIPGDPVTALARSANTLVATDLLIIHADQDAMSLQRAWFYVPRMLHTASVVLWQEGSVHNHGRFRTVPPREIERLARLATALNRAA
jgi:hypothetical protein